MLRNNQQVMPYGKNEVVVKNQQNLPVNDQYRIEHEQQEEINEHPQSENGFAELNELMLEEHRLKIAKLKMELRNQAIEVEKKQVELKMLEDERLSKGIQHGIQTVAVLYESFSDKKTESKTATPSITSQYSTTTALIQREPIKQVNTVKKENVIKKPAIDGHKEIDKKANLLLRIGKKKEVVEEQRQTAHKKIDIAHRVCNNMHNLGLFSKESADGCYERQVKNIKSNISGNENSSFCTIS